MKKSGSLGVWLGRQKEKEIFKECSGHFDKIFETVEEMRRGIEAYGQGDLDASSGYADSASALEKSADEVKKRILDELVQGMFHPIDRDEILRLVLEADGIASNAKAAIGKLNMIPRDMIPDHLSSSLVELAAKLSTTVSYLRSAFSALVGGRDAVFSLCQQVENCEEEIDDFRVSLVRDDFLPWCQEPSRAGMCIILKEAVDNMEKVADQAEDVADVIRSIAILSS
jgi:predicted phosphate transport protein (TIGR00153 family)